MVVISTNVSAETKAEIESYFKQDETMYQFLFKAAEYFLELRKLESKGDKT